MLCHSNLIIVPLDVAASPRHNMINLQHLNKALAPWNWVMVIYDKDKETQKIRCFICLEIL